MSNLVYSSSIFHSCIPDYSSLLKEIPSNSTQVECYHSFTEIIQTCCYWFLCKCYSMIFVRPRFCSHTDIFQPAEEHVIFHKVRTVLYYYAVTPGVKKTIPRLGAVMPDHKGEARLMVVCSRDGKYAPCSLAKSVEYFSNAIYFSHRCVKRSS